MANIKISELNPLLTVEDADVLPIVDNAVTKKVTAAILRSYTQGNSVLLTGAQTVAGIKTFTSQLASSVATGTAPFSVASTTKVTNLNADLLDGLSSADFQATLSGTGIVKSTAGTISYLTDNSTNWNTAFNDSITSAAVTGSGTNTLTLTQQDAGTITATWVNGTLIREVRNTTGATLTKGTIVYISGATGNKPTVTKAIASGDSTSAQTFGFIQSDLANNDNGYVVVVGDLTGVDTSAFAEGAQLYLSSTVAGTFTDVKQYAPAHLVYVGIVTRSHPTLGQIEVNIQNGYELDELHNVSAQSPSNGDILQFVTSTGLWTKVAGTTTNISEGTNLYFTNARSRSAISESVTGLDYNSTTGVLSTTSGYGIPTTASQATWDTAYNDSIVSAAVTGTTTKTLTLNQQDGGSVTASWTDDNTDAVSSVFGRTGAVVAASGDYTTTQVTEGTNLYFTDARARAAISLTTTGTSGAATYSGGVLNIPQYQAALTNPITGTGTTNYLPKFTGTSALGDSNLISNSAGNLGLGITPTTNTGAKYIQFGAGAALNTNSTNNSNFWHNTTFDASGNALYAVTGQQSSFYRQINGAHRWYYASAGTAGNAITFTEHMALDASGQLSTVGDATINGVKVGRGAGNIATNTALGSGTLNANTTGATNTAVGVNALTANTTGSQNTSVGVSSLPANNTGSQNTAIGRAALFTNTTGINNTGLGYQALYFNSVGSNITALGAAALLNNTASNNTAVGFEAATTNTSGTGITAIGYQSLRANTTGVSNTAVGIQTLTANTTGANNTAIGKSALIANTTGFSNTAIGESVLLANVGGTYNTAIGSAALSSNVSGSNNIAIGRLALQLNTANNNTSIGFEAGSTNTTGANNIFIGYQATGTSATDSNKTWIGNASTTSTWLAGNVLIGTTTDAGYKLDVNGTARVSGAATFSSSIQATQGKFYGARPQGIFTENNTGGLYLRDATSTSYKSWSIGTNDIVLGFAITASTTNGGSTFTTPLFIVKESGTINMSSLPTSSAGLSAGDIWNDGGTLKIV